MQMSIPRAVAANFLGKAPNWYKQAIVAFLVINPLLFMLDPFIAGWALVAEFIFTLAMALKCYPLQPGGILLIQALFIGMTTPEHMKHEMVVNVEVILLLVFMVAGIYFMKGLLLYLFTKLLLRLKNKITLSIAFAAACAFLSAFLDALTVVAVIMTVAMGFYSIYHKVASGKDFHSDHDHSKDEELPHPSRQDLEDFRAFLRNLMMHAAIGTALGGVMTMVGEPQNLIIADKAGWNFVEFFIRMSPVTVPVFIAGLLTTYTVEKFKLFTYGAQLSPVVRDILTSYSKNVDENLTTQDKVKLSVQVSLPFG
jgi:Na+:H+ antiporter, NhaB family